ncbi:MAG TPA: EAL domain-containing protein [Vitreimonas sp.]|uniref:putative bifunctional diguanylate cyclase/phosphodiesterase n=1 Tax=Vitreimonas sp. TaxID=3069702 RepID=UPI002D7352A9|nr:EAL domain-containing protein [Vitreimonas sp.]HYD88015.1 EAL domain-containing protein [Vitreimonas sp.]
MFVRLRHKLTVLYAGLFCAALILIGGTAYVVIADATQRLARDQLVKASEIFERSVRLRTEHLAASADSAANIVSLQQAAAGRDESAIRTQLEALRDNANADLTFLVTREGLVIAEDANAPTSVPPGLQRALAQTEAPSGILVFDGRQYHAATARIPGGLGWLVVGGRLDGDVQALEELATIPLDASTPLHTSEGWAQGEDAAALGALIERQVRAQSLRAEAIETSSGRTLALATPLPALDGSPSVLLLRYQLDGGLTQYSALFGTLLTVGLVGLSLLIAGSWLLANDITRPLSTLESAAQKLQEGVFETVAIVGRDELARLAASFNAMTGALRERERKITHLAYHDAETRLPNRLALERRLASAPQPERVYLAAIGVDRFTEVRGAIGYTLAGALMRVLGQRLLQLVPNAPVARLSSDVLGVGLLADSEADARKRASALIGALEQPLALEGHNLDINVTIGLAQPRAKTESPGAMIERASVALDQARSARQKLGLFDEAAYGDPARNLSLMSEMRRAVESGELMIVHQPKYDFRTGRIGSAECLVRWRHPTRGMIAPDLFIPMAEETGHIRALTEWVLRRAIVDQKRLAAAGWPLTLAVNVSGRLIGDDEFARAALELVAKAPHQLCFEITETAVIDNPQKALENIELFASKGVRISIDDYGSGLSSLAYLKQLPAHELKIDKLFVQSITNSQRDALLVRSTIELAHGLGLDVVAEGVETPGTFALLASMKCDLTQGYLIARPATIEELIAILGDEKRMRFYQQTALGGVAPAAARLA